MKSLLGIFIFFCSESNTSISIHKDTTASPPLGTETNGQALENKLSVSFKIRAVENEDKMTKTKLDYSEKIAGELFKLVEKNNLIVAGKSEQQLNDEVVNLAREKFGIEQHWHKKIVRCGANTTAIYPDNPPNLTIQKDDLVILDFGVVVDGWESDYARTYVLGNNPQKLKLKNDVEKAWEETRAWVKQQKTLKASDLFAYTREKSKQYGWTSAGEIAGHIVGKFPHELPADPKSLELDVHPDNPNDMFLLDANGNKRHWILEMHFIDKENKMGAYFEQLL
jgi:Xaa-Pro aminopeptidase